MYIAPSRASGMESGAWRVPARRAAGSVGSRRVPAGLGEAGWRRARAPALAAAGQVDVLAHPRKPALRPSARRKFALVESLSFDTGPVYLRYRVDAL